MNKNTEIIEKINKLKKEKNAVILAHSYQNVEIDEVADFSGDSMYLSREAAKTNADIIVFAGVYFMAETAKILSPNKKVLLPNKNAGCLMADMVNLQQLRQFKSQYPDLPVVCYINSTAEVKSESDICCTSANAVNVVRALGKKEVLFVPDANLGGYVAKQLPDVNVITYNGNCPIHHNIKPEDILAKKKEYPNALVMIHPECQKEVVELADFVGSTTAIIKEVGKSNAKEFIIVTEKGVVDRLNRDFKDKNSVLVSPKVVCESMKQNSLLDILNTLEQEQYEVVVDKQISQKAFATINKMLTINS